MRRIVQQLVLQGHPVPPNILLLRKSLLTPDGIMRQLTFNAWLETLARMPPKCSPAKPSYIGAFDSRG